MLKTLVHNYHLVTNPLYYEHFAKYNKNTKICLCNSISFMMCIVPAYCFPCNTKHDTTNIWLCYNHLMTMSIHNCIYSWIVIIMNCTIEIPLRCKVSSRKVCNEKASKIMKSYWLNINDYQWKNYKSFLRSIMKSTRNCEITCKECDCWREEQRMQE